MIRPKKPTNYLQLPFPPALQKILMELGGSSIISPSPFIDDVEFKNLIRGYE